VQPFRGFSRFPNRVLKDDEMPALARLVYARLGAPGNAPTVLDLARDLGCSKRHAMRMLDYLEKTARVIAVTRQAGRPNEYALLVHPVTGEVTNDVTGDMGVTGQVDVTGDTHVTTTSDTHVTTPPISTYRGLRIKKERETPPPNSSARQRAEPTGSLFASQQRDWLKRAVEYFLDERPELPELLALRAWFPALVAEFFLSQSWQRPTDPENAFLWARSFATIGAEPAETRAAFDWALASPGNVFSRPDHLRRLLGRVKSQRQAQRTASAPVRPPVEKPSTPAPHQLAWREAGETEREQARASVRRRGHGGAGPMFDAICQLELLRLREAEV
jgi:hypothetical protein